MFSPAVVHTGVLLRNALVENALTVVVGWSMMAHADTLCVWDKQLGVLVHLVHK